MSAAASFAASPPGISTKAELDHLTNTRPEPAPEPHLTPNGPDAASVQEQVAHAHESRIGELHERLEHLREGADRDFTFSALDGHAKADFGHSR